ncbi:hypothetical protein, partial [Desulfovibrio porci]|uniref:hypothetical protein n=1 Tax=Desulfovibrio porci TaxID=2605782 RepID=UPI003A8FE778
MMGGWSAFQFAERRMPPWTKSILRPGNGRRTAGRGPAAGGVIWRFLLLAYWSTLRAKSAIFLVCAEKSYFLTLYYKRVYGWFGRLFFLENITSNTQTLLIISN